jgi:signal peptidase I
LTEDTGKPRKKGDKNKKKRKHRGRELVECLAVAGLLALTIRQFGFQLFKIPTRSMEPTLIGHEDYGDRVVSAMWYNRGGWGLKLAKPRRWQVIVFEHFTMINDKKVDTNFIKRLIGLPGEEVHIRDGDIWINGPLDAPLRIERKPPGAQQDLWIGLCDLDFSAPWAVPHYWKGTGLKLDGGSALLASSATEPASLNWTAPQRLDNRFVRLTVKYPECPNPECRAKFKGVFDTARPVAFCPRCHEAVWGVRDDGSRGLLDQGPDYWVAGDGGGTIQRPQVSDLMLELDFELLGGSGELTVTLTGRGEPCALTLPLGHAEQQQVGLSCPRPGETDRRQVSVLPGQRHRLEVQNVDGLFSATLDGLPVGSCEYTPRAKPGRSDAAVSLTGAANLRLGRIRLSRDVYYGHMPQGDSGWEKLVHDNPDERHSSMQLLGDQYLLLGDNQLASHDGRAFGPKTEKQIVARGLFVAWPPSRMRWLR